ncbi:CUB and sushi domain-containing protein 1-like [Haliotis rufescens]|uniref:CUB and sushi domain-containing protein 1-like n=1 Tax=Haliotis rufescens TaxID=6454 RepID=UPI00201E7E7D|nr:CUB and sushi domain-containing protein 1-like [Haliotis rufescens]
MDVYLRVVCAVSVIDSLTWACSENHVADSGTFTSPNYPADYPRNLMCTYTLAPVTPGATLRLIFEDFHTEEDHDVVKIYDANDKLLKIKSGGRYKWVVIATLSYYKVVFSSDNTNAFLGFNASWSVAPSSKALDYQVAMATTCPVQGLFQPIPEINGIRKLEIMASMTFHKCMLLCQVLTECSYFKLYATSGNCYLYEEEDGYVLMYDATYKKVTNP